MQCVIGTHALVPALRKEGFRRMKLTDKVFKEFGYRVRKNFQIVWDAQFLVKMLITKEQI